jgi:hypothetical protein
MLDKALQLLADRLNQYLGQQFDLDEKIVQLGSPASPDGVMPIEASDRILVFLTNINKDTLPGRGLDNFSASQQRSPLYLNLFVAVAANFRTSRYLEALNFLSHAILCFQQFPVIDHTNQANMPAGISKLILDIENTSLAEESNLWGILGGRYLPSILYKVRMLTVVDSSTIRQINTVGEPNYSVGT